MAIHRSRTWLLAWALHLVLAGWAVADQPRAEDASSDYLPMVDDAQIFSPGDFSEYGSGPPPNTGWFFSWDYLRWGISVPAKTDLGNPHVQNLYFDGATAGTQINTHDTSYLGTGWENGYRWEGGFMEENRGWLFSAFQLYSNNQRAALRNVGMNFQDPGDLATGIFFLEGFRDINGDGFDDDYNGNDVYGRSGRDTGTGTPPVPPLDGIPDTAAFTDLGDLVTYPVLFDLVFVKNHTEVSGLELMRLWRLPPGRIGGTWEVLAGIRYLKFYEYFDVSAAGGVLANSFWNTVANNNLVGPQIGLRGAWRRGRWGFSTEGRFFAAANNQQLRQRGEIASLTNPGAQSTQNGLSLNLPPTGFDHGARMTTWAPAGEFRIEGSYQLFSAVSLNVGWTGLVLNGIARPSEMINYRLPDMGILIHQNQEQVFVQGLNLGIEVNR